MQEEILYPDIPIIDPHHHLWDRPGQPYFLDDLLANLLAGHDVRSTVFVECRAMYRPDGPLELRAIGETEFATAAAEASGAGKPNRIRVNEGIVAFADLILGSGVDHVLDAHEKAAGGRLRGIRQITAWNEDGSLLNPANKVRPGMMAERAFREGFARLAPRDLVFDAWLLHPQLAELDELAAVFPETTIVLDHLGGPIGQGVYAGRRDEAFREWRAGLRKLAGRPNIVVKVGGLGMPLLGFDFKRGGDFAGSAEIAAAWKPYIVECVESFGASRCMFESNFPVDLHSCSYAVLWNAFKHVASELTSEERASLFHATAARIYRLAPAETSS